MRLALSADGETHASAASYNNHWGVPLSLARCPAEREIRRVRDRHEPCRRDHAADATGAPARRHRHRDRAGASGIFRLARKNRRRQGGDFCRASSRAAPPCSTATTRNTPGSPPPPRRRASPASSPSASTRKPRRGLCATRCKPNSSTVEADILGQHVTYKLGAPGRHLVLNSLAVLAAVRARRRRSRARRARARQASARDRPRRPRRARACRAAARC